MELLKELLQITEAESKKTKKDKKDKSADKYLSFVSGNMIMNHTCSGDLSGNKKTSKDTRQ